MRIDSAIVERARSADMIHFLEKHNGFTFAQRGGEFRCGEHQSLAVKADRLSWYWHSKGVGGYGALDYLMKIEGKSFPQAVDAVAHIPAAALPMPEQQPSRILILPEKAGILQSRAFHYLQRKRGIDTHVIGALMNEGKIYEDKRGNVVFVGFDEENRPRFCSLRGTSGDQSFRMDCAGSDKRYGFHMSYAQTERLFVFESPIDAMSHASIENVLASDKNAWQKESRLSLAGTSDVALPKYLETHPHIRELVLCLDNDLAGREASVAIARKYSDQGFRTRLELPQNKDYNEDLERMTIWQKSKSERSR